MTPFIPLLVAVVAIYHVLSFKLLSVDKDYNCMRKGFEIHACQASLPHVRKKDLFHKLICVI